MSFAMKKRFPQIDARQKITGNYQDARQLLKRRQVGKKEPIHDARFKIRAKKFQPLKQEMLKIKSSSGPGKPGSIPGRTINNKRTKASEFKKVNRFQRQPTITSHSSSMRDFISVENGQRKLLEKVTLHHTGLKVAVRNDLAIPPKEKKTRKIPRKSDHPLKITLSNPHAIKRPSSASFQPYKAKIPKQDMPIERQRHRPEPRPLLSARNLAHRSPLPSPKPTTSFSSSSGSFLHHPILQPQHRSTIQTGIRPMSSSEAAVIPLSSRYEEPLSIFSPLEGTKILVSNLHPVVVEDDILELFSVTGPVRRARMVDLGKAEVVFVRREDAIHAYHKYNNRDLDGQPMYMKLMLRNENPRNKVAYSWMNEIGRRKREGTLEIEPSVLQRSLFKTNSSGAASAPVVFTVKI